jgi:hypothetical protein
MEEEGEEAKDFSYDYINTTEPDRMRISPSI